jgi:hypothetical protein
MNKKSIIITASIVTGMVGLAMIVRYYYNRRDKDKKAPPDVEFLVKTVNQAIRQRPPVSSAAIKQNEVKPTGSLIPLRVPEERLDEVPEVMPVASIQPLARRSVSASPAPVADEFPLRKGSKGKRVERLQVFLMRNYGHNGKVTGVFDEQTEAELKKRMHKTVLDRQTYENYRMGNPIHEQVVIR